MSSPESNFWMNKAGPSCGNRTCSTPLSAAISRLQRPVCWQTASTARTPSPMISRATSISSALTHRDAADNGLTMEKAQALGLNFCKENFPGHPAIVCTHPDGHNHSGNIHVHIVIGSIRTREVERKPYMQKPRDWREGMKHSSTAQTMRHLRVAGHGTVRGCRTVPDRPAQRLERARERSVSIGRDGVGSRNSTVKTQPCTAAGQPPTAERSLKPQRKPCGNRSRMCWTRATSFEDFSDRLMQQYGIAVKESRGRLSYLPAGRTKFIRAKQLGDKFDKAAVLATLQANAERKPKAAVQAGHHRETDRHSGEADRGQGHWL